MKQLFVIFFLGVCSFSAVAIAAGPSKTGTYGVWSAYTSNEEKGSVCYMAATPKSAKGAYKKRDDVFALVTHRPAEDSYHVFTYIAGYSYKSGSEVTVTIDGRSFVLFTKDNTAWTPTKESDRLIVDALRKGSTMVVKGVSARGTKTTDSFSLKGSGDAYKAISQACGVRD